MRCPICKQSLSRMKYCVNARCVNFLHEATADTSPVSSLELDSVAGRFATQLGGRPEQTVLAPQCIEALKVARRLAELEKRDVAVGFRQRTMKYAVDTSTDGLPHTALVNFFQTLDSVSPCVYLTTRPSDADLGIFIEKAPSKMRLFYFEGTFIVECKPSRSDCLNVLNVFKKEPDELSAGVSDSNLAQDAISDFAAILKESLPEELLKSQTEPKACTLNLKKKFDIIRCGASTQATHLPVTSVKPSGQLDFNMLNEAEAQVFDDIFMLAAYALASSLYEAILTKKETNSKQSNTVSSNASHGVGALYVSDKGEILSWGIDMSGTYHAEVSTLKLLANPQSSDEQIKAKDGGRLYTSLEPCFMCAGQLSYFGSRCLRENKKLTVLYGLPDVAMRGTIQQSAASSTASTIQAGDTFLKNHSKVSEILFTPMYKPNQDYSYSLESKRVLLSSRHQQANPSANPQERLKFERSVIQTIAHPTFGRRLVKAVIRLAELQQRMATDTTLVKAKELSKLADYTLNYLANAGGFIGSKQLLTAAAQHLNTSARKNEYRIEDNAYKTRERTDYVKHLETLLS